MIRKIIKYQLWDLVKVCLIYILVLTVLMVIGFVGYEATVDGVGRSSNGMTGAIFCMIVGMCMFKEHFWLCLQNGISRRSYYLASAGTMGILSVSVAAMELFSLRLLEAVGPEGLRMENMGDLLYSGWFEGKGFLAALAVSLVFSACMNLAGFAVGFFIAEVFYRLGKTGRILLAAGLPVFLFIGLPVWFMENPRIGMKALELASRVMGLGGEIPSPATGCATMLIGALVFLLAGYPVIRKAEV